MFYAFLAKKEAKEPLPASRGSQLEVGQFF
jgi:hypothetical protein